MYHGEVGLSFPGKIEKLLTRRLEKNTMIDLFDRSRRGFQRRRITIADELANMGSAGVLGGSTSLTS
jgi:hypothetical protein